VKLTPGSARRRAAQTRPLQRSTKVLRFQLLIETGLARSGYTIRVLSPRGEGRARFVPRFTPAETRALDAAVAWGTRDVSTSSEKLAPRSLAAAGERLSAALFQGEVLRLYERSLDLLEGEPEARLRLEILLDPRDRRLARLQQLPWELLRQPGSPEALALSRRRPLVRYLAVPRPVYAARRPGVLRILAVGANPCHADLPPLDLARELRNLREAVGAARHGETIEIVEPEAPTLAALRRALLDKECHVLHFMGHGGSVPGQAERVLFFDSGAGSADPVRGADLANKLEDFPTLRLAVLNACESAATPAGEAGAGASFDPFAGVATSLVLGGLPAVVAMRLPISDRAAIAFSRAFYQGLAAGDPVDAAVAEGRQAVHSAAPAGFEWATPVLFMRTPNGELYPEEDISPDRPRWVRWPRRLAAALLALALTAGAWLAVGAWRVEHLVAAGVALAQHGQWPEARKVFLDALRLAPRSAEVHSDLAGAEERAGYLAAAEKHYRQAVRLQPRSAEHLYNLGYFLNGQRRYHDAYEALKSAVQLEPSRVDAYGELASAAMGLGLLDDAREALTTALRLDPARPALHRRLGELELSAGRPDAAIVHLDEARRRYPPGDRGGVQTVSLLVQAHDRRGDRLATCREASEFRRLDAQAITPWAPLVAEAAARRGCRPER
jgi:Tfp pilus assembly protein PilF